jgi:4-cresol dehydrogenase (hydroxylating)
MGDGASMRAAHFAQAVRGLIGDEHVVAEEGLDNYVDPFPVGDPAEFSAGLAVRPGSTDEVSAVVRAAAEHGVELWPISQGRNNGYGGRSPRTPGAVVVDLSRMNRVLDIDPVNGTVLVEPGVRFSDLYEAVRASGAPFWTSAPDLSWGSVVGNALERGLGYTAYGEHNRMICGMEVVLPDGEVVRTGMGAMTGNRTWQLYGPGFGPSVEGLFSQSNLGIVTRLGLWLMPRPEAWAAIEVSVDAVEDAARPLRLDGTIPSTIVIGDPIGVAAFTGPRSDWQEGTGLLDDDVEGRIMEHFGVGRWTMTFALYGRRRVLPAQIEVVRAAFADVPSARVSVTEYDGDTPVDQIAPPHRIKAGIPGMYAEKLSYWFGPTGGHISFAPVMPIDGATALDLVARLEQRFRERGIDFCGAFTIGSRSMVLVSEVLYDTADAEQVARVRALVSGLIGEIAAEGYAEYRGHLAFMDRIARTFDWNDHALGRLHTRIKDALDPVGLLAPGKQGVWPTGRPRP